MVYWSKVLTKYLMGLFFPSKPSTPPASSHPTPHTYGHVTKRELEKDVMGRLRRDGLNEQERTIVGAAAAGHMDKQGFMSSGMNHGEKEEMMADLRHDASKLHLEPKDLDKIDDAFNRAL